MPARLAVPDPRSDGAPRATRLHRRVPRIESPQEARSGRGGRRRLGRSGRQPPLFADLPGRTRGLGPGDRGASRPDRPLFQGREHRGTSGPDVGQAGARARARSGGAGPPGAVAPLGLATRPDRSRGRGVAGPPSGGPAAVGRLGPPPPRPEAVHGGRFGTARPPRRRPAASRRNAIPPGPRGEGLGPPDARRLLRGPAHLGSGGGGTPLAARLGRPLAEPGGPPGKPGLPGSGVAPAPFRDRLVLAGRGGEDRSPDGRELAPPGRGNRPRGDGGGAAARRLRPPCRGARDRVPAGRPRRGTRRARPGGQSRGRFGGFAPGPGLFGPAGRGGPSRRRSRRPAGGPRPAGGRGAATGRPGPSPWAVRVPRNSVELTSRPPGVTSTRPNGSRRPSPREAGWPTCTARGPAGWRNRVGPERPWPSASGGPGSIDSWATSPASRTPRPIAAGCSPRRDDPRRRWRPWVGPRHSLGASTTRRPSSPAWAIGPTC